MTIRAPLTQAEKEYISNRKRTRASATQIATELNCSPTTVRKWYRYQWKGQLPQPRGRPATGILSSFPFLLAETAVALKRAHPHWGPVNVRLEMIQRLHWPETTLPSRSRLSALFHTRCPEVVQPHRRRQYRNIAPSAVTRPHQRWQIDGKEKVPVGSREVATLLEIRDPVSAMMIGSRAILTTTPRGWRKVTLGEAQDTLRQGFTTYGLPLQVQTDHEVVYTGSPQSNFPSRFTLWLMGLHIEHIPSRDHCPTDQPQIERNHRTLGELGWKDQPSTTVADLQMLLDHCRERYNHDYPTQAGQCNGQPPLVAHPQALHSGRPYHPDLEWLFFDMERVQAFLAQQVWPRHVSASGNVGVGDYLYSVGRQWAHQQIAVRYIPDTHTFRFEADTGEVIKELPAKGLDKADLIGCLPVQASMPIPFQLPLPLEGV